LICIAIVSCVTTERPLERGIETIRPSHPNQDSVEGELFRLHPIKAMTLAGRTLKDIELSAILETLDLVGGNRTAAARQLGISVRTIRNKIREIRELGMVPQSSSIGDDAHNGFAGDSLRPTSRRVAEHR